MKTLKDQFSEAIEGRKLMALNYEGKARKIIPLISGRLKNGIEAILCFRIIPQGMVIRLYHWNKISDSEILDDTHDLKPAIDYYLTKHFKAIFNKA